jgi:hypothetical protein
MTSHGKLSDLNKKRKRNRDDTATNTTKRHCHENALFSAAGLDTVLKRCLAGGDITVSTNGVTDVKRQLARGVPVTCVKVVPNNKRQKTSSNPKPKTDVNWLKKLIDRYVTKVVEVKKPVSLSKFIQFCFFEHRDCPLSRDVRWAFGEHERHLDKFVTLNRMDLDTHIVIYKEEEDAIDTVDDDDTLRETYDVLMQQARVLGVHDDDDAKIFMFSNNYGRSTDIDSIRNQLLTLFGESMSRFYDFLHPDNDDEEETESDNDDE